jgi:hypothetical protein
MPDKLPDPADLQKFFENWWRTAGTIITTIAAALGSLQITPPTNYIIAGVITVAGLAIAIFLYRRDVQRREKAEQTEREVKNAHATAANAFRGLRRFLRGETLPGIQRRRQAAQLSRQVMHPDFKIALVTGDSGAGKSSMLECAIVKALEDGGHSVAMISNPARLASSNSTSTAGSPQIAATIKEITDQIVKHRVNGSKGVVLILDQFEELLSRFRNEDDRSALGDCLWKNITDGARVIIGIRKEYIVDVRSVTARFGYSVSFEDTFLIENFDINEATGVIQECATQDQIKFDPELPKLIAQDLAVDDRVRPADLQIVCTALSGDLTTDRYKREGGAAGLRSRFVKGVIDITGDAVLARSVLRQLCDIPNNKKAEPLSTESIAEKARAGAPGQRATPTAVTAILQALEQARVVIPIDSAAGPRWSLIHDYFVEPIKLATEEQNTRSEAAAARLDYFVTRAKTSRARVPLADLRVIQRDAPPAALKHPAARSLIRRSLLVGYGAPAAGAVSAAFVAVAFVIFATTERQWRVVDEKRSGRSELAALVELDGRPKEQTVVTGIGALRGARQLTTWDAKTGRLLGSVRGSLIGQSIWNYNPDSGLLRRLHAIGTDIWSAVTPKDGRPSRGVEVSSFEEPHLYFAESLDQIAPISFNLDTKKWTVLTQDKMAPTGSAQLENSYNTRSTKFLRAYLVEAENTARLTVWTAGYEKLLLDEQIDLQEQSGDKVEISLLELIDLGTQTILSFNSGRMINNIAFDRSSEPNESSPIFTVGERKKIAFPDGLNFASGKIQAIRLLGKRIVVAESSARRTIFWIFNPGASRFEETITGVKLATGEGYAWMPEDESGFARFWLAENSEPIRIDGMRFHSDAHIEMSPDKKRALVISEEEGNGNLWEVDFSARKASALAHITVPENGQLFFSSDGQLALMRQPGGLHEVWDQNGSPLGSFGPLGSEVKASSYRSDCRQIFIWNEEGQRLDFRRGFNVPMIGFVPERECPLDMSRAQRLIGKILARLVN